jgi:hypothetical protein
VSSFVRGAVAVLSCSVLLACGGDDAQPEVTSEMQDAAESMASAAQQMQQAAEKMAAANADVALISASSLQDRLPESIDGMARGDSERSETGTMGFKISSATATYSDDARSLEITLTDVGGTGMLAAMGAAWAMVDLDRSSNDGYEKTVTIDGNRGYEKEERYDGGRNTELSVIVGGRLLVKLDGTNVAMDVLRRALEDLKVNELAPAS